MNKLIDTLNSGGIAVILTDTIYGLVGQALNQQTVSRIYEVKERMSTKPLIILIGGFADLDSFNIKLSKSERSFIHKNWPGKVSVIIRCEDPKYGYLTRSTGSLAFRMVKNEFLKQVISAVGPLVAPNANPEGLAPAKDILEAKKYFNDKVDLYVAGGSPDNAPSTLVSLLNDEIVVLRPGETQIK